MACRLVQQGLGAIAGRTGALAFARMAGRRTRRSQQDHDQVIRGIPALASSLRHVVTNRNSLRFVVPRTTRRRDEMSLFSGAAVGRLTAVAGLVLALSLPSLAQSPNRQDAMQDTGRLAQSLRAGGYNIVVRHGATFSNQ